MAKEQNLSLNPVKISGTCGRLMCCLKYEQASYLDMLRTTPRVGTVVTTPAGKGTVVEQNLLRATVAVQMEKNPDASPQIFSVKEVRPVRNEGPKGKKMEANSTESDRKS